MATPITPYSGTAPNPATQTQPEFDANTQAWVDFTTQLPDEINQFAENLGTANTNSTSVTSLSVGTGPKSLTVDTGKAYFEGQSVTIARTSAPTNRMFTVVDSYDSGTGALVVTSQAFEGSGTFTDWTITLGFNGVISNAQLGADVFASSAENAAGTVEGKAVDPLGIREAFNATGTAPVYACRAWVNFSASATPTINESGNVSSITDISAGEYEVNLTTALQDAFYAAVGGAKAIANTNTAYNTFVGVSPRVAMTSSMCPLRCITSVLVASNSPEIGILDPSIVTLALFR